MKKNTSGQKVTLHAYDAATGLPKTGDAANLTFYVAIDDGTVTALTDTSAAERDATKDPGGYQCDVSQAETNGDKLDFSGKSTTANVVVMPLTFVTAPVVVASIATDAITDAAIATGAIASTAFAAGAIDAAAIANGAIDNATFATDTVCRNLHSGACQANGGANVVTLASTASDIDNWYDGHKVHLTAGDGAGQSRVIASYVGSTRVATLTEAWTTTKPAAGTTYVIEALGDVEVGVNNDKTGYALSATQAAYAPAKAGDAMALTSGERTTLAGVVWALATSGMTTAGSIGKKLADWVVGTIDTYTGNTKQTGDAFALIGTTGSGLTSLASQTSVNDIPTNSELATALAAADDAVLAAVAALNNLSAAQAQTAAADALVAVNLDHLMKTPTAGQDMTTEIANGSALSRIISGNDTANFVPTWDSLVYARTAINDLAADVGDGGLGNSVVARLDSILEDTGTTLPTTLADIPTAADNADAVWAEDVTTYSDANSAGKTLTSVSAAKIADAVWNETLSEHIDSSAKAAYVLDEARDKASTAATESAELTAGTTPVAIATADIKMGVMSALSEVIPVTDMAPFPIPATGSPSALLKANLDAKVSEAGGAAAVWDAVAATYDTPNTMGARLNDAGGATDPLTNPVPGTYLSGTAGAALGNMPAAVVGALGAAPITILSPMDALTGDVTVVIGQSYEAGALQWEDTGDDWDSLTGAVLTFEIDDTPTPTSWTPVEVTGGAHQAVKLDLTPTQTSTLSAQKYIYEIWASYSTGNPLTVTKKKRLATGYLTANS